MMMQKTLHDYEHKRNNGKDELDPLRTSLLL